MYAGLQKYTYPNAIGDLKETYVEYTNISMKNTMAAWILDISL
jgi:hypothetical protein